MRNGGCGEAALLVALLFQMAPAKLSEERASLVSLSFRLGAAVVGGS